MFRATFEELVGCLKIASLNPFDFEGKTHASVKDFISFIKQDPTKPPYGHKGYLDLVKGAIEARFEKSPFTRRILISADEGTLAHFFDSPESDEGLLPDGFYEKVLIEIREKYKPHN